MVVAAEQLEGVMEVAERLVVLEAREAVAVVEAVAGPIPQPQPSSDAAASPPPFAVLAEEPMAAAAHLRRHFQ